MSFEYLGLSDEVLAAVNEAGYTDPTPIQKKTIPSTLQGRDILGIAQTGTGKTASFTLPMIDILSHGRARARMPRSLILEPTRELAAQVEESFEKYGKHSKLSCALLIGGTDFVGQSKKLDKGVDVLIATPGRLLDHMERGNVMLTGVELLVVDEADRMLDMGFIPDIERICKMLPKKIQSLFFSATMPPEVKKLTDSFLKDPKEFEVSAPTQTAVTIEENLVKFKGDDKIKRNVLRHLIDESDIKNAIIFCNRKKEVKIVNKSLNVHGYSAAELHGDLHQDTRMETLAKFKNGDIKILVASDVAARGLDIPDVGHVFNYDIPSNPEDYIHRIGRTGRAGKEGTAYTLSTHMDKKYLTTLLKFLDKDIPLHKVPKEVLEDPRKAKKRPLNEKKSSEIDESNQKDDKVIVGMGDHVPDFLLR
ncbi:DEAD/DEAH box helicase [Pseudemcibacter aquimaris]|uniref:DEAD/DEAH box helicase n=1 Tax=Pseudemcibacter aquimaris TaxID=2857064 RepID=UPI002012219F|nr:DEAD/DEAH box helicase [Pseudemcibacter aquimaris]MCC3861116.1 DEAD/DEAH box helicase [Pseudemcibacter aquimaris]WDU59934.1 DEAD/DEAH box helicase [Pseudemcibacter aquimaris]